MDDGESPRKGDGTILLPMFFATDPMEHGIITRGPRTLADLTDFLAPAGLDLIGGVRHRLSRLMTVPADVLVARVLLVVLIPKIRRAGARNEAAGRMGLRDGCDRRRLGCPRWAVGATKW